MESEGLSPGAVAGLIGVSRSTLEKWAKEIPEFSAAKSLGEAKAQLFWERQLVNVATKGGAGPGASTACIFALKNRARDDWRDMVEQKHVGDPNSPVVHRIERVIVDPSDPPARVFLPLLEG